MKVLAVDFGCRRVGLAVGDSSTRVATPLPLVAVRESRAVIDEILKRIGDFEIERIVVGYPLNMDGSRGSACAAVERFAAALRRRSNLPVELVNEQLTSVEAEELGKEMRHDFRKRRTFIDSLAAQLILQRYFEKEVKR